MTEFGYGGKILRIDLNGPEFTVEPLDTEWMRDVIGGRAANTKRLFEELDPGCDPLGPDNILIFGIGPLTGTLLPASAYFTVSAKSPLTGILGDSAAGGQFAAELKQTGFDQIIITGRASELLYISIDSGGVRFTPCKELADRGIVETTTAIRQRERDHRIQVAAIGLAGVNQVRFASVVSSGNRVCGRTGMGAVMGSKNVKAIAVRGFAPVRVADPVAFESLSQDIRSRIRSHEEYKKRHDLGTTMLMSDLDGIGILPTNHFLSGSCGYLDKISGETLAENFKVKNKACFNCPVHCSRYYVCGDVEAEGPEFETLCSFTSRIGIDDLPFALEMNRYLNQVGMDSISTGEIIGWLMEAFEKGIVSREDLDGCELRFGDKETVRTLVKMIAHREGIGAALALGATAFAKRFSEPAQKLVMQVKGLDLICGDPRGIKAYGLTYAVASRGGDHLRAEPYFELTEKREEALRRFGTEEAANRLAESGKAALVTESEKIALLTDCITMCKNIGLCMDVLTFETTAALLRAGTGIDYTPDEIEAHMAEAVERDRDLNWKFGVRPEHDTLPDRFVKEPLDHGPSKGSTVDIERMVTEYNRLHKKRPSS